MIKFWTSNYELQGFGGRKGTVIRKGALLKVEWPNGFVGYSDLLPWPEFGDSSLEAQIQDLKEGRLSALVEQSIWLAKRDAQLRKKGKNAFAGAAKVKNHYLLQDFTRWTDDSMKEMRKAGFTTLKVKVGTSVVEEAKFVSRLLKQNPVMVRLDFNGKVDFSEFERFFSYMGPAERARVEFVEDPIPWDLQAWTECAKIVPLALDFEGEKLDLDKFTTKPPFSTLVIKPARRDVDRALKAINRLSLKMVVTSSLDHPVGVAHACSVASELKKFYPNTLLDCGCLTLGAYQPNEFSAKVTTAGPYLKDIPGTGVGFNELLEKSLWTPVNS